MKNPHMKNDKKKYLKVKCKFLDPITTICNNQTHKMYVIPQGLDKDSRKNECNCRPIVPNRLKIG